MKTDIARKEFILDQLNILKIKNYEFVEAVNGKEHISSDNCDADKFKNQFPLGGIDFNTIGFQLIVVDYFLIIGQIFVF